MLGPTFRVNVILKTYRTKNVFGASNNFAKYNDRFELIPK